MLLDKYDPQAPPSHSTHQSSSTDPPSGRYSVTKLPRISHTPSNVNSSFNNDLLTQNSRQPISIPNIDKISTSGIENPVGRGPKIYTKNLPDVFLSGQPGSRPKKSVGAKERNKGDYGEQLALQLATPPSNHFFPKNIQSNKHQPFISPARLAMFPGTKVKRKLDSQFDPFHPSMKENIEGLALRFSNVSPSRRSNAQTEESYVFSPAKVPQRVRIRTNVELGPLLEKNQAGRNIEEDSKKQLKKMIVFKKKASNTSESKFFDMNSDEVRIKMIDKASLPSTTSVLQLSELITVKKVKSTTRNGVIKRMLHAPSFRLFDILEEPISDLASRNYDVKSWINTWKMTLAKSQHTAKIYSCFWNSPEGHVSILLEASKKGFLIDVVNSFGSLPEKSLKTVAKEVLTGIYEIQSKLCKSHGSITANEIMIDAKGSLKICPNILNSGSLLSTKAKSPKSIGDNILKPSLRFPQGQLDEDSETSNSILSYQKDFAQDIFDFGFILLQCALGDLSTYDLNNLITLENLKSVMSVLASQKKTDCCCLLHDEDLVRKLISINGFHMNNNKKSEESYGRKRKGLLEDLNLNQSFYPDAPYLSLYEVLSSSGRYSEAFLDFLCGCLKLDSEQRHSAESLLDHEFLNEYHEPCGPQVSFQEVLKLTQRSVGKGHENEQEKEVNKIGEALRVVFLNRHVKDKFDMMVSRSNRGELDEKRVMDLAGELGVSAKKLKKKLTESDLV